MSPIETTVVLGDMTVPNAYINGGTVSEAREMRCCVNHITRRYYRNDQRLNSLRRIQWFPSFLELKAQCGATHPWFTFGTMHSIGYIGHGYSINGARFTASTLLYCTVLVSCRSMMSGPPWPIHDLV